MSAIPDWFIAAWRNTAFRVEGIYEAQRDQDYRGRAGMREGQRTFTAVLEGTLKLRQGAWSADLRPGDQVILQPGNFFSRHVLSPQCRWATIDFRIESTGLGADPLPMLGLPAVVHVPLNPEWVHMYRKALAAMRSDDHLVTGVLLGRGWADLIIGRYLQEGIANSRIPLMERAYVPPWLVMVRERIANGFNIPDIDPIHMAREAGYSKAHFYSAFKKAFGVTPMGFLWEHRMQMAIRKMDSDPALAVGDVAQQCGFRNHTHFTRLFRQRFGVPPTQWRQKRCLACAAATHSTRQQHAQQYLTPETPLD